jgi:formamidopyrimidine-DNA glycosylase
MSEDAMKKPSPFSQVFLRCSSRSIPAVAQPSTSVVAILSSGGSRHYMSSRHETVDGVCAMPEALEIELYRRSAEGALNRRIVEVMTPDGWYLKQTHEEELTAALVGNEFTSARRHGKLLLLTVGSGRLGLRFGMTGRLVVDGDAAIDELLYSSHRNEPQFERFAVRFGDGGRLSISDPRRLGGVELDPDVDRLGPDVLTVTEAELSTALRGGKNSLKARLLDQERLAGIGNLLADEILWRAKLSPLRVSGELSSTLRGRLHREILAVTAELLARGGSHMGNFMEARSAHGRCPRCSAAVRHDTVGGRSTYWCPREQK